MALDQGDAPCDLSAHSRRWIAPSTSGTGGILKATSRPPRCHRWSEGLRTLLGGYPHIEKGGVKRCRPPLSCVRESTCPSHASARSDGPTWFGSHALRDISVPDGAGRGERLNRQLHLSWIQEVGTAPAPSLRKRRSEGGQRFGNPSNHLRKPCRSGPLMCVMTEREQIAHPKCGYLLLTGTGVREGRSRRAYHGAPKGALCGYGLPAHVLIPWYGLDSSLFTVSLIP